MAVTARRALSVPSHQRLHWACPRCTLHNRKDLRLCDACGEARASDRCNLGGRDRTVSRSWNCSHCTFINFSRDDQCEMCLRGKEEIVWRRRAMAPQRSHGYGPLEAWAQLGTRARRLHLQSQAAKSIQTVWRGFQGRRSAKLERDAQERHQTLREQNTDHLAQQRFPSPSLSLGVKVLFELRADAETSSLGWSPSALPPGQVVVAQILPSSWAERHGLCTGDELISIGVTKVSDMEAQQVVSAMRQRPLQLTFVRACRDIGDVHEQSFFSESDMDMSDEEDSVEDDDDGDEDEFVRHPIGGMHSAIERADVSNTHMQSLNAKPQSLDTSFTASGFPVRVLGERDLLDASGAFFECAICLQDYDVGDVQMTLPCFHAFHQTCVGAWMRRSCLCPCCKHPYSVTSL